MQLSTHLLRILLALSVCCALVACGGGGGTLSTGATPVEPGSTSPTGAPPIEGAPLILYTDITSGPNSGGENNKGIYLSIFGKNFGSSGLGTSVKVFINDVEVDHYRSLGIARARPDIGRITVQIGAIGNPASGAKLPIKVVVGGVVSNTDLSFTVNPGNIYFVDPVNGVDTATTNTGGGFSDPFKTVQKPAGLTLAFAIVPASTTGAWGRLRAGDFVVMRGGSYATVGSANQINDEGFFVDALNKSGCPVGTNCPEGGGTSSGPITFMGYPGETAFVDRSNSGTGVFGGGFSSADSTRQLQGKGAWINVTNLKIESGFADGAVNTQRAEDNPLGANWRVVNNEMTGFSCLNITLCRGGAIAGSGEGNFWVGNYGHDIYDTPDANTSLENHGIYIGGGGSYEIAYNVFANIKGGNGIQVQAFYKTVIRLDIHHNEIRDIGKHGLNFVAGTGANTAVWNNLIYNTDFSGVRFNDDALSNFKLYNNTFYNIGILGNQASGTMLTNDSTAQTAGMYDIRNNIFVANVKTIYNNGNGNYAFKASTVSNNLWYGAGPAPAFDLAAKSVDPNFITAGSNFRLASGSSAINAGSSLVSAIVKNDFDITLARPKAGAFDIGAFEQ